MGDCGSRLSKNEIEQHIKDYNPKNDKYFRTIPYYYDHPQFMLTEDNLNILDGRKSLYDKKTIEYMKKCEEIADSDLKLKEIVIELQKGIYLGNEGYCLQQNKVYAIISLEPNGPYHETFSSDIHKPIWYDIFKHKSLIQYNSITIIIKSNDSSDIIGSLNLDLTSQIK